MLQSSSSEKRVNPLKIAFLATICTKGVILGNAQNEKKCFLEEITKADH